MFRVSEILSLIPSGARFAADSVRIALGRSPKKPFVVGITINTACNLRCSYCFIGRDSEHFPDGFARVGLDTEKLKQVLTNIRRDTSFLIITGGEPFLRKDLEEILKFAKTKLRFANISIATNGLFLEKKRECLKFVDRLGISYDLTRAREYPEEMTSMKESLSRLHSARALPPTHFTMTLLKGENLDELTSFCEFCKKYNFRIWAQPERDHGDFSDWPWFLATLEELRRRFGDKLILNDSEFVQSYTRTNPSHSCLPELRLQVKDDGKLSYPCNKLENLYDGGSLLDATPMERWEQAKEKFGSFPNEKCGNCGFTCYFETAGLYHRPLSFATRALRFMSGH